MSFNLQSAICGLWSAVCSLQMSYTAVIQGPARFLTMAEVAEVEDSVVIIDCVAIVHEEGEGGEHYRKKNKFRCRVSRIEKRLVKLNEKIW